jgi:hypothetical protein
MTPPAPGSLLALVPALRARLEDEAKRLAYASPLGDDDPRVVLLREAASALASHGTGWAPDELVKHARAVVNGWNDDELDIQFAAMNDLIQALGRALPPPPATETRGPR